MRFNLEKIVNVVAGAMVVYEAWAKRPAGTARKIAWTAIGVAWVISAISPHALHPHRPGLPASAAPGAQPSPVGQGMLAGLPPPP